MNSSSLLWFIKASTIQQQHDAIFASWMGEQLSTTPRARYARLQAPPSVTPWWFVCDTATPRHDGYFTNRPIDCMAVATWGHIYIAIFRIAKRQLINHGAVRNCSTTALSDTTKDMAAAQCVRRSQWRPGVGTDDRDLIVSGQATICLHPCCCRWPQLLSSSRSHQSIVTRRPTARYLACLISALQCLGYPPAGVSWWPRAEGAAVSSAGRPVVRNVSHWSPAGSIFPLNHRRTVSGTITPERARRPTRLPPRLLAVALPPQPEHGRWLCRTHSCDCRCRRRRPYATR